MKWFRMLGLYFERVFEYRLRSLVWLLIPMTNNFALILFWSGAGLGTPALSSYYILMTVGGMLTTSHVEGEIAEIDIKQGQLINTITKPISYYWVNLLSEIPYRVMQAFYASLIISVFLFFFPGALHISLNPLLIPMVILIFVLGYFLSFTFKLCLAYSAFWFTDARGLFEFFTIAIIIFSGGIMPIPWYPPFVQSISSFLPFAYSGYYCIISLQGAVPFLGLLQIIAIQGLWLCALLLVHNVLWKNGIKKFTAVGQ